VTWTKHSFTNLSREYNFERFALYWQLNFPSQYIQLPVTIYSASKLLLNNNKCCPAQHRFLAVSHIISQLPLKSCELWTFGSVMFFHITYFMTAVDSSHRFLQARKVVSSLFLKHSAIGLTYFLLTWSTERRGPVVSTPASYSWGHGFKSRPGDRLSWLRC
jgi:hypothetical protein